jgi:ribonuclease-3
MASESVPEAPPVEVLEQALGHRFDDRALLEQALQHASWANERADTESNERLEFLGDAVIGLVTAHLLFETNPAWDEGALTRALHLIVDRRGLSELARRLGVGAHLRLGTTERQSQGHEKDTILADAMEALIGALYLDAGLAPVRALVLREFADVLEAPVERDPKTRFQELVMARHGEFPVYALERDSGIEGDEARFTVRALVGGEPFSMGVGRSKRAAEFEAAARALVRLEEAQRADADRDAGDE